MVIVSSEEDVWEGPAGLIRWTLPSEGLADASSEGWVSLVVARPSFSTLFAAGGGEVVFAGAEFNLAHRASISAVAPSEVASGFFS